MRTSTRTRVASFTMLALALGACAHGERQVVRLEPGQGLDLKTFDMSRQSLIIELREGEVVPIDVILEGDYFSTAPGIRAGHREADVLPARRRPRTSIQRRWSELRREAPRAWQLPVRRRNDARRKARHHPVDDSDAVSRRATARAAARSPPDRRASQCAVEPGVRGPLHVLGLRIAAHRDELQPSSRSAEAPARPRSRSSPAVRCRTARCRVGGPAPSRRRSGRRTRPPLRGPASSRCLPSSRPSRGCRRRRGRGDKRSRAGRLAEARPGQVRARRAEERRRPPYPSRCRRSRRARCHLGVRRPRAR